MIDLFYLVGVSALVGGLLASDRRYRQEKKRADDLQLQLDALLDTSEIANRLQAVADTWDAPRLDRLAAELEQTEGMLLYTFQDTHGEVDETEWFASDAEAIAYSKTLPNEPFVFRMIA